MSFLQVRPRGVTLVFRLVPPAVYLAFTRAATTDVDGKREGSVRMNVARTAEGDGVWRSTRRCFA